MKKNLTPIALGNIVRDLSTGLQGTVMSRVTFMNGNLRYNVQPKAKEGSDTIPSSWEIDVQLLEYVEKGIAEGATPCVTDTGIELGTEVIDLVSNMKGIATQRHESYNGCVYYAVQSKWDAKNPTGSTYTLIEYSQLKTAGSGVRALINKAKALAEKKSFGAKIEREVPQGGPTTLGKRL